MNKIDMLRHNTYIEAVNLLKEHGKCAIVRPTGFGKTGILTRLIKEAGYKNVLYLYPNEVIKNAVLDFYYGAQGIHSEIDNVTFKTYAWLSRQKVFEEDLGYDLIICDECHILGAKETKRGLHLLLNKCINVHLVGATATPDRMDLEDEIHEFFDDVVVSKYNLHDAFKDGVLKKPYYCYCSYTASNGEDFQEFEKDVRIEVEKMHNSSEEEKANTLLKSRLIQISTLFNMENIIKETCNKYVKDTSYMKFIVFFTSIEDMHEKEETVKSWFKGAYPTHNVNTLKVSSESPEYSENTNKLCNLVKKENTIDLILCIDMMNTGYHVDSLTGICMYRGTGSSTVYIQQLGRALNSGSKEAGIVFDWVDNLHRESAYDVLGKKTKKAESRNARISCLLFNQKVLHKQGKELSEDELIELNNLLNEKQYDNNKWWKSCNDLEPKDLIATGHEATYREFMAKTVAEIISMRCRQAVQRWVEDGGKLDERNREYILGQQAPDNIPLEPYCRLKNVTLNQVLDWLGV